jgi:xanthine dehydrogenase accessory factor
MVCGGRMDIFIDVIEPKPTLLIVGAGHIAYYLARLGHMVGFSIAVIDDRKEFANRERFPNAERVICDDMERTLSSIKITPSTYVVIVTRGHQYDLAALKQVIDSKAAYIGMIGSKSKVRIAFQELKSAGIAEDTLKRVHAPIGLDIGAETPQEIAVSIIAEIIKVRRGGTGESLVFKR